MRCVGHRVLGSQIDLGCLSLPWRHGHTGENFGTGTLRHQGEGSSHQALSSKRGKSHWRNLTGGVSSCASSLLHLSQALLAAHPGNCSLRQKLPQHLLGTFPYICQTSIPKSRSRSSQGAQTCCHQTLHPSGTSENGRGPWGCLGNISAVHPPEPKQKTYV